MVNVAMPHRTMMRSPGDHLGALVPTATSASRFLLLSLSLLPSHHTFDTLTMRTSTFALFTALPLLASAVPTWSKDDHSSSGWKDDKSASTHHGGSDWLIGDGPFDFTSTYSAWATPDQVYVVVSLSLGINKQTN